MRLEDEIKQSAFPTEQSKLIVNLIYTSNRLKEKITARLKSNGLTMQQYNVLRIVRGAGDTGSTTSEIRERLFFGKPQRAMLGRGGPEAPRSGTCTRHSARPA